MKKLLILAAGFGFFAVTAMAQSGPVVEIHAVSSTEAVHADSHVKVAVVAKIASGYHINDHKPSLEYLIPTKFVPEPSGDFTVKDIVYPKGTPVKLSFSDSPLSVYQGSVIVGVELQSAKSLKPGNYQLKAKFAYQACSDHACLAPASVPVVLTLKVVPDSVPLKATEPDVFKRIKFD